MNKKRVGIVVSTVLVLVMSIALLAGCGLDINFRKKVEKKDGSILNRVDLLQL